jgi:hypothetical protein
MSDRRQLEQWGGWEQRHPPEGPSVAENVDRAIFGGFSEGHPGNREAPRGR